MSETLDEKKARRKRLYEELLRLDDEIDRYRHKTVTFAEFCEFARDFDNWDAFQFWSHEHKRYKRSNINGISVWDLVMISHRNASPECFRDCGADVYYTNYFACVAVDFEDPDEQVIGQYGPVCFTMCEHCRWKDGVDKAIAKQMKIYEGIDMSAVNVTISPL